MSDIKKSKSILRKDMEEIFTDCLSNINEAVVDYQKEISGAISELEREIALDSGSMH